MKTSGSNKPPSNQDTVQVAEAINRLSHAIEHLELRYETSERAKKQGRYIIFSLLLVLGIVIYQVFSPLINQLAALPQIVSQVFPGFRPAGSLEPKIVAIKRQRLMDALSPEERNRIESFEKNQKWISDYIATTEGFDPGATIALFLSNMAASVKVMPTMNNEVHSMTEQIRIMNKEMQKMNTKMNSIPVMASDIKGMHQQMMVLPVLADDIRGMNFYMSIMAKDMNNSMGKAGRLIPWSP